MRERNENKTFFSFFFLVHETSLINQASANGWCFLLVLRMIKFIPNAFCAQFTKWNIKDRYITACEGLKGRVEYNESFTL